MGFILLSSVVSSTESITDQRKEKMNSELRGQSNSIDSELQGVSTVAYNIAELVGNTYQDLELKTYEDVLAGIIEQNELISGSGIWFEPNVYDAQERYVGPYIYKDGDSIITTYDYSNAEYNYFQYEFYTNAVESQGEAVFTDPYYDETSDTVMSSCSVPIYTKQGKFIGAITVDIILSTIQDLVDTISVGENGKAFLLNAEGVYLSQADKEKVMNLSILEEENTSLAAAGNDILLNQNGQATYKMSNETYSVYYQQLELLDWTLCIQIPNNELLQPVNVLVQKMLIIGIAALVIISLVIVVQVQVITQNIKKVNKVTNSLAERDFTVDPLMVKTKDEIGVMSGAINQMYERNKFVISEISNHASILDIASEELSAASVELQSQFTQITELMHNVNDNMMSTSGATEEVNASVEEVNSSINLLVEETTDSEQLAMEIKKRAQAIMEASVQSFQESTDLSERYQKNVEESIENAKVVDSIGVLADVIAGIAEQINLLSLNASIEAARAGEQGRGFAVVAGEIGKLASETAKAVDEIKQTIDKIQNSFNGLIKDTDILLQFIMNRVTPDYKSFVEVAEQYGLDAEAITTTTNNIVEKTGFIHQIISEVTDAITNIAESSQEVSTSSAIIMEAIDEASNVVEQVNDKSIEQETVSRELTDIVKTFKL